MANVIIAKNVSSPPEDLPLTQLSAPDGIIPASGQVTLTDFNTVAAITGNAELTEYIANAKVILNIDGEDQTQEQSANFIEPTSSVAPLKNNFEDDEEGYSVGSTWINVNTDTVFQLTDASTGAAVWQEIPRVSSYKYEYATRATREAAVLTAGDLGVFCLQADNGTFWRCVDPLNGAGTKRWSLSAGEGMIRGNKNPNATPAITGNYGQRYHDTTADVIYTQLTDPSGTNWVVE